MPQPELVALQQEFSTLCRRIDPTHAEWQFQTAPAHDGTTHVEIRDGVFHYIGTDRGVEVMHQSTGDRAEMLYWLLKDVTWGMAVGYEFRHRIRGQSFRRLLFAKHLEYLGRVDPAWTERLRQEIAAILAAHPYDDEREG